MFCLAFSWTFGAILHHLARKGGDWQLALQLLEAMRSQEVRPNVVAFSAVLSACENRKAWQAALAVLREAWRAALQLNAFGYSAVISAMEKSSRWRRAVRIFEAFGDLERLRMWSAGGSTGLFVHLQRHVQRLKQG